MISAPTKQRELQKTSVFERCEVSESIGTEVIFSAMFEGKSGAKPVAELSEMC